MNFFDMIAEYLGQIWTFVTTLLQGLVQAIAYVLGSTVLVTTAATWLPPFAGGVVIAVFGIAVTKFLVGR